MNYGILWVGIGDGRIVLIDSKFGIIIVLIYRYCGSIRVFKFSVCKSKFLMSRINFICIRFIGEEYSFSDSKLMLVN